MSRHDPLDFVDVDFPRTLTFLSLNGCTFTTPFPSIPTIKTLVLVNNHGARPILDTLLASFPSLTVLAFSHLPAAEALRRAPPTLKHLLIDGFGGLETNYRILQQLSSRAAASLETLTVRVKAECQARSRIVGSFQVWCRDRKIRFFHPAYASSKSPPFDLEKWAKEKSEGVEG
jgi:hypothetical protein